MDPDSTEYRPPRPPLVSPGEVEPFERDMTATIAADVTLGDAQRGLAEVGQWLPIDGDPSQPVGRLVETNSTGPLRLGYGAWRDLLLGCQFRNGRGELITAGGRAVKNVAGYDLTKFMVGQQRVLGTVETITVRTYRRPAGAVVVRRSPWSLSVTELLASTLRPQWMMLTRDELCLGYLGDEATLELYAAKATAEWGDAVSRRSVEEDVEHRATTFSRTYDQDMTFRASIPPEGVPKFGGLLPKQPWAADPVFGIVRGVVGEGALDSYRSMAADAGGTLWLESGETIANAAADETARRVIEQLQLAFGGGER